MIPLRSASGLPSVIPSSCWRLDEAFPIEPAQELGGALVQVRLRPWSGGLGWRGGAGGKFRSSITLARRVRIITSCVSTRTARGSLGVRWSRHDRELRPGGRAVPAAAA